MLHNVNTAKHEPVSFGENTKFINKKKFESVKHGSVIKNGGQCALSIWKHSPVNKG